MKNYFIITLIFMFNLPANASELNKACTDAPDKKQWAKLKIQDFGYQLTQQDNEPLSVDLGTRQEILVLWVAPQDCLAVTQALELLEKIKKQNIQLQGVSFVFSDQFKHNKITLKDFVFPVNVSINGFLKNLEKFDKNPVETLELTKLEDEFKKLDSDLKKVIDENEIKKTRQKLIDIKNKIKNWSLEKALKFKEQWLKQEPTESINSKVKSYQRHIVLHDKLRRGLWEESQKDIEALKDMSPKLLEEIKKGKTNLEIILKQTKNDILQLEKDIQNSFKNKSQALEGYEI